MHAFQRAAFAAAVMAGMWMTTGGANGQIITQWNFNSTTPDANTATGTLTPSIGTGTASLLTGNTATFAGGSPGDTSTATDNSGWNVTTYAAQGAGSGTRGVQFTASTLGVSTPNGLRVSFDFRQSATASRFFQLQVTSDGTNYVNASGGTASFGNVNSNTGTTFTNTGLYSNNPGSGSQTFLQNLAYDFAPGSALENNANFGFRFVAVFDPVNAANYISANAGTTAAYSTSGTSRFDIVTITPTPVPEPTTILGVSALAFGLVRVVRRRRAGVVV